MSSRESVSASSSTASGESAISLQLRSSTLADISRVRVPGVGGGQTRVLASADRPHEDPRRDRGGRALVRGSLGDDAIEPGPLEREDGGGATAPHAGPDGSDGGEAPAGKLARER